MRQTWIAADAWRVGRYIIMPDHIHYFAVNIDPMIDFDRWVRYWKSQFSRQWRTRDLPAIVWQTDHWDTTIRCWKKYDQKWEYVRNNAVRHGLAIKPEHWPYQGEIHHLTWD